MKKIVIRPNKKFNISDIVLISENKALIEISPATREQVKLCFEQLKKSCSDEKKLYGYNTGVADLCNQKVNIKNNLQKNLLLSHSCGIGNNLDKKVIRVILFSRILELSKGYSGISSGLLDFMVNLLNKDVIPLVPSLGSIGCSDLTILAQLFASIYNKGKVLYKNKIYSPFEAFKKVGINYPVNLQAREGLALINGNAGTIGLSGILLNRLDIFIRKSIIIAVLSLEARRSTNSVIEEFSQSIKPFPGNFLVVSILRKMLKESDFIQKKYDDQNRNLLQDPLSFRCIPQIIGNAIDVFNQAKKIYEIELNGVTDNPLFIPTQDYRPISTGNFFCSQLATCLDQLSLVIFSLTNASVARLQIFTNDKYNEGIPKYLIEKAGIYSGLMIPVYTAQTILSEIRALCYPRSALSVSVANGWEDISTNAFNCALNLQKIMNLAEEILAIELFFALQAISLRLNKNPELKLGKGSQPIVSKMVRIFSRKNISLPIEKDIFMKKPLEIAKKIIVSEDLFQGWFCEAELEEP